MPETTAPPTESTVWAGRQRIRVRSQAAAADAISCPSAAPRKTTTRPVTGERRPLPISELIEGASLAPRMAPPRKPMNDIAPTMKPCR